MKIFGREPAMIVGFIESALVLLLTAGLLKFVGINNQEEVGIVMAVVSAVLGVYVAYVTSETLLAAVIGLVKAAVALAAVYKLNITLDQTAALIAFVTMAISFWQRGQTSPLQTPSLSFIAPADTTTPKAA